MEGDNIIISYTIIAVGVGHRSEGLSRQMLSTIGLGIHPMVSLERAPEYNI